MDFYRPTGWRVGRGPPICCNAASPSPGGGGRGGGRKQIHTDGYEDPALCQTVLPSPALRRMLFLIPGSTNMSDDSKRWEGGRTTHDNISLANIQGKELVNNNNNHLSAHLWRATAFARRSDGEYWINWESDRWFAHNCMETRPDSKQGVSPLYNPFHPASLFLVHPQTPFLAMHLNLDLIRFFFIDYILYIR